MFSIKKMPNSIFVIEIFAPRDQYDEVHFMTALKDSLKEDSFGLVISISGDQHFSSQAKKDLGIWFKNNKDKLKKQCLGIARVKPFEDESQLKKSLAMKNAMPCPYHVVPSLEEGIAYFS